MKKLIVSTKQDIKMKSGKTISANTLCDITPVNSSYLLVKPINEPEKVCRMPYEKAYQYLTKFKKAPTIKTLEKYVLSGITKNPLGNTVEPDGYDCYGIPSWCLIMF